MALAIDWTQKFLQRHPELQTSWIPPSEKKRTLAGDPPTTQDRIGLFKKMQLEGHFSPEDVCNMDGKVAVMGAVGQTGLLCLHKRAVGGTCLGQWDGFGRGSWGGRVAYLTQGRGGCSGNWL